MSKRLNDNRLAWVAMGMLGGLCLANIWPHEPAVAGTSDRAAKFGMITVPVRDVTLAGVRDTQEGVFILDYLTGRLQGAVLSNRSNKFARFYAHPLAIDFNVDPNAPAGNYCMTTGTVQLANRRGMTWANAAIYVAELTSGKCIAYGFPYNERPNRSASPLIILDGFAFRQPMDAE